MRRFRYWLADVISGGELTFQKNGWARSVALSQDRKSAIAELLDMNARQKASISEMADKLTLANMDNANGWHNSERFEAALARIAAEVKPTSNATVKRMGRIASEALK
jgi:hypothetical protein